MQTITIFLTRIYRSVLPSSAHEEIVWKDLKNLFDKMQWRFGVFEKEKHIESSFEIDKDISSTFHYMIYNENHHCRTLVANKYPTHLTSNIFILASHFNNLLQNGTVKIKGKNIMIEALEDVDIKAGRNINLTSGSGRIVLKGNKIDRDTFSGNLSGALSFTAKAFAPTIALLG